MSLITEQGRRHAVEQLKLRRAANGGKRRISQQPTFLCCRSCREALGFIKTALCLECNALQERGWLQ